MVEIHPPWLRGWNTHGGRSGPRNMWITSLPNINFDPIGSPGGMLLA